MKCRHLTALAVLLAVLLAPRASASPTTTLRFALVIGHNAADSRDMPSLRYADDDAISVHQLLSEAGVDSTLLVEPDAESAASYPELPAPGAPSFARIERVIAMIANKVRLAKLRGVNSEFMLFYSGHGDADGGEGYVAITDGRLSRSHLYALLETVAATRNHVLIDACRSYFMVFDRGPGGLRKRYLGPAAAGAIPAALPNTGFVLSTASDRESHEWERFRGGILSHEVRSALRGGADLNQDGVITYAEMGAFISKANAKLLPRFRPDILLRAPDGELDSTVLAWRGGDSLELGPSDWGHVYVETLRGERLLDVHPATDALLTLRLPRERPLFVRRHDESMELVLESGGARRVDAATGRASSVASRGAASAAFEQLFSDPLMPHDLDHFVLARNGDDVRADPPGDASGGKPRRLRRTLTAAVATVGAGLLGSAFGLWLRARRHERDLSVLCGPDRVCPTERSDWPERRERALNQLSASRILGSIGAAAAATALLVGVWPSPHAAPDFRLRSSLHCERKSCLANFVIHF